MTTLKRISFNKALNCLYITDTKSLGEEFPHLYFSQQEELYTSDYYHASPFYRLEAQFLDIHRLAADQLHHLRQQQDEMEQKFRIIHKIIKAVRETDTLQVRPKDYMKDIVDPEFENFLNTTMLKQVEAEVASDNADDLGGQLNDGFQKPYYMYFEHFESTTSEFFKDSMKTRELEIKAQAMLRIYQSTNNGLEQIARKLLDYEPSDSELSLEAKLSLIADEIPAPQLKSFLPALKELRDLRNKGVHYFENQDGKDIRAEEFGEPAILFQFGNVSRLLAEVERACAGLPADSEARQGLGFQTSGRGFTLEDLEDL